jgi:thiosulfate/3-mercaptopyruvate sulfurtransferase
MAARSFIEVPLMIHISSARPGVVSRSLPRVLVLAAAVVATLAGAARAADEPRMHAPALRRNLLVSADWLARHLDAPRVAVLHVAPTREGYDAGHIPGARYVSMRDIAVDRRGVDNEIPPLADLVAFARRLGLTDTTRIVIYGEDAGLWAARAFVVLDYLGLGDQAALLDGQLPAWRAGGRALTTEVPAVTPSSFVPRLRPEVIVTLDAMRDLDGAAGLGPESGVAIIDARPASHYTGTDAAEGIARPGHIPGAASLYWMKTVVSKENPVLRPPAELRDLFSAAGARPGDVVVTYCRSGIQASYDYFVARYLGYDARLYDGSFSEWSAQTDTPVATGAEPGAAVPPPAPPSPPRPGS